MFKGFNKRSKILVILVFVLLLVGLIIISSAGVIEGQKKFDDSYYFLKRQLMLGVLPGLVAFFFLSRIKHEKWRKLALFILLGAVALTVAVFIPALGYSVKGAQRWVGIGPIAFQPSEFLKLALIIYLAALFSKREKHMEKLSYSMAPFIFVMVFIAFLLVKQPDVGTLSLLVAIGISMYFFYGAKLSHFGIIILVCILLLALLVWIAPYRFDRVQAFLDPEADVRGISYHINQALIGIGSGGIWGTGIGLSQQKLNYLPEPVGDSIFAILVEETGFIGGVVVVGLFLALNMLLISIAKDAKNRFGQLFVLGMAVWISGQAFMNMAALIGLMPLTGIPLPFISFGNSALVSLMAGLGIVVNISNQS
ncbi:MAG: putative lipid II flippase FtsW [Candidatus Yanofskybacteria bacterium CG10_big_fil_rev_8_21_14_0_10_36_16]|uniref:Probable peptidoglycan glycosyltransferase FtsW n=1 Tax=Candidatus Yanofskybacteria bacterium CG10_big_fil_rev_8_21_14_0_10_36_16 TaxID=1975096 RepID=A0A2J0Q786_9BACT|nr:MAG: putative lipid II flippase FtsW [Candidatus Yanofskybacteria bacterium CG10_big_fil_rev_8_21_14_0_10_36_16]